METPGTAVESVPDDLECSVSISCLIVVGDIDGTVGVTEPGTSESVAVVDRFFVTIFVAPTFRVTASLEYFTSVK